MRFYKNVGPYHGRQPEQHKQRLEQVLRQPAPKPSGGAFKSAKTRGIGDVKETHLTGKGSPYSVAHYVKKK